MIDVRDSMRTQRTASGTGPEAGTAVRAKVTKNALRELIRAQRLMDSGQARQAAAHNLCEVFLELLHVRRARSVALYASGLEEPGTHLARRALAAIGVRVLLPVFKGPGEVWWIDDAGPPADIHFLTEVRRAASSLSRRTLDDVAVVLVPALAVDTLGRRLGHGSGHYDPVLSRLGPDTLKVAAVYEREVFDAAVEPLPTEDHDIPIDAVITPSHVLHLA